MTVVSRKTYEAEKKKDAERRKKEAEGSGIAGAMVNAFAGLFEGMFGDIGENDVLVRVEDKGKKVFSVDVVDAAGKPVDGMGSMKVGDFWILKFTEKRPRGRGPPGRRDDAEVDGDRALRAEGRARCRRWGQVFTDPEGIRRERLPLPSSRSDVASGDLTLVGRPQSGKWA